MIVQCTITPFARLLIGQESNLTNIRRVLVTRSSQCLTPAIRLTVFVRDDICLLPVSL